jgi:hypothetical protein
MPTRSILAVATLLVASGWASGPPFIDQAQPEANVGGAAPRGL